MENSAIAKNLLAYLENYWIDISRGDRFLKECVSENPKTCFTQDTIDTFYDIKK